MNPARFDRYGGGLLLAISLLAADALAAVVPATVFPKGARRGRREIATARPVFLWGTPPALDRTQAM